MQGNNAKRKLKPQQKLVIVIVVLLAILAVAGIIIHIYSQRYLRFDKNDRFEYLPVKEAVAQAEKVEGREYQNFTIPENIDITAGDKLFTFTSYSKGGMSDQNSYAKKKVIELSKAFAGQEPLETENFTAGGYYGFIGERYFFEYHSSDSFTASDDDVMREYCVDAQDEYEKVYKIGVDDISSVSYKLAGKDYSIQEALDFCTDYINNELAPFFQDDITTKPYAVYVMPNTKGEYYYSIIYNLVYKGTEFSNFGRASMAEDFMMETYFHIEIAGDGLVNTCSVHSSRFRKDEKEVREIISLESALDYLEDYLAQYSGYEMTDISLQYCTRRDDIFIDEAETRPMWVFTVSEYPSRYGDWSLGRYIYLDAISGDVFCYDSSKVDFIF